MERDLLGNVKDAIEKGKDFVASNSSRLPLSSFSSSLLSSFEIVVSPAILDFPRHTPPSIPPSPERHVKILKKIDSLRQKACVSSVLELTTSPKPSLSKEEEEEKEEERVGGNLSKSLCSLVFDEDVSSEEEALLRHLRLQCVLSDFFCAILSKTHQTDFGSPDVLISSSSFSSSSSIPLLRKMVVDCTNDRLIRGPFVFCYLPSPDLTWTSQERERNEIDPSEIPPQRSRMSVGYSSVRYIFQPLPLSLSLSWAKSFSRFMEEMKCFPFALVEEDAVRLTVEDLCSLFGENVRDILRELKREMEVVERAEGRREEGEREEVEVNGADFITYPEVVLHYIHFLLRFLLS